MTNNVKLSVSVPEPLWHEVQMRLGVSSPSAVVQQALAVLLDSLREQDISFA